MRDIEGGQAWGYHLQQAFPSDSAAIVEVQVGQGKTTESNNSLVCDVAVVSKGQSRQSREVRERAQIII